MTAEHPYRLTSLIKRLLDTLRILMILALIIWPLAVFVMSIGKSSSPDTWGVDIDVYAGFTLHLDEFSGGLETSEGVRDPKISGKTMMSIDTHSLTALLVFTFIIEVGGIIGLYVVTQLRSVFASLAEGSSFGKQNSLAIRKAGFAVIAWSLLEPVLQYFGGRVILSEYALDISAVSLYPSFSINGTSLFIGVSLIVLSGVLNEATRLHEDQQLTI